MPPNPAHGNHKKADAVEGGRGDWEFHVKASNLLRLQRTLPLPIKVISQSEVITTNRQKKKEGDREKKGSGGRES